MNTTNVISTPNITGNVGSCKSEKVELISGRSSFFKETTTTVVTNSCTGITTTYETWGYTPSAFFLSFVVAFIVLRVLCFFTTTDAHYR